jgi:hypothetical protein
MWPKVSRKVLQILLGQAHNKRARTMRQVCDTVDPFLFKRSFEKSRFLPATTQ